MGGMFHLLDSRTEIAELQGLYGPLRILEGKVQQVWTLQQLQPGDWRTASGQALKVKYAGRWNRGAGPDFKEVIIEVDGTECLGDAEIHLYRDDWWRHGHHLDPAYDTVILHIILFAGGMEREVRTARGKRPHEWVMGPWMREDVESVAGGEPGLFGELAPELREWMEADSPEAVRDRLKMGADRRWQDKEAMARFLLNEWRWEGGLHRMTLFYLGYPFNRRPFYEMAEAYPPAAWKDAHLLEELRDRWADSVKWGLGRPANQAENRLKEYGKLNRTVPGWMNRLRCPPSALAADLGGWASLVSPGLDTRAIRKAGRFQAWSNWLAGPVLGGVLSRSLADRLWIDVFLPVLVAGERIPRELGAVMWFHAVAGLFPEGFKELIKLVGIQGSRQFPLCNGWVQGLLWADDQLRLERIRSSLGNRASSKAGLTS